MISGFTYVHNAIESGYPIVEVIQSLSSLNEVVVVDAESSDGTPRLLGELREKYGIKIFEGPWGTKAGETLEELHAMHKLCQHECIIHAEADEIYDPQLMERMIRLHKVAGEMDAGVHRIQVEQNFQRVRQYPVQVHRMFRKGSVTKVGHTTNNPLQARTIFSMEQGMLWDCTNCFRDNWVQRCLNNAALWNEEPSFRAVGEHATKGFEKLAGHKEINEFFMEQHWRWLESPLKLPANIKHLVGQLKYTPRV